MNVFAFTHHDKWSLFPACLFYHAGDSCRLRHISNTKWMRSSFMVIECIKFCKRDHRSDLIGQLYLFTGSE